MKSIFFFRFWINILILSAVASPLNLLGINNFENLNIYIFNFIYNLFFLALFFKLFRIKFYYDFIKNFLKICLTWALILIISFFIRTTSNQDINFIENNLALCLPLFSFLILLSQIYLLDKLSTRGYQNVIVISDQMDKAYKFKKVKIISRLSIEEHIDIKKRLINHNVSKVIFDVSSKNFERSMLLKQQIDFLPIDIFIIKKDYLITENTVSFDDIGCEMLLLSSGTLPARPLAILIKRSSDFFISLFAIIVLLPFFILISFIIVIESKGPPIFMQLRNGMYGKEFMLFKFRSMHAHNEKQVKQAIKNDSRVTKFGLFLRRTSIDEFPQLFNVLLGDMSLVGPRPHAVEHNEYYSNLIKNYMARHRTRPGITGYAQVNGFRGETKDINLMKQRVKFDLKYIENWSLWLDFKILMMTPIALFKNDAY